jgi:hypothetical protein
MSTTGQGSGHGSGSGTAQDELGLKNRPLYWFSAWPGMRHGLNTLISAWLERVKANVGFKMAGMCHSPNVDCVLVKRRPIQHGCKCR